MSEELLISILSGVLISVITSYLTAKFAISKFYTEKWWERKEQAYTEIINALYDMVQFYQVFKEDYGQDDFISQERSLELHQRHNEGFRRVRRATDLATLYMSDDAAKLLKKLREREGLHEQTNPMWDVYEDEYNSHSNALDKLIMIAKKDLKK